jgi:hypothetical protein
MGRDEFRGVAASWVVPIAAAALAGAVTWGATRAELADVRDRARITEECVRGLTRSLDRIEVHVEHIRSRMDGSTGRAK